MKSSGLVKLGLWTTLISFLIGSIIFGLYFSSSEFELLFIGYGYIVLAGLINFIILCIILFRAFRNPENRKKHFFTAALMSINIPIMLLYCHIAIILINTMRITFTNETQTILTDINVVGCETKHIEKLDVGESKTVWVGITGDCAISIDYLTNGERKEEVVAGYVSSSMGKQMTHRIGEKNNDFF